MTMQDIITFGGFIGAIAVIINFLVKTYDKLIAEPDRKMAEKIQNENSMAIKNSIEPLTKSIELLNSNLEDSRNDRKRIHIRIDEHEVRITDLENGGLKNEAKKQYL